MPERMRSSAVLQDRDTRVLRARLLQPIGKLCEEEPLRFLMFVIASGLSVPVNLSSRMLFSLFVPFELAIALSHLCGMVTAYTLTKLFVFDPSGKSVWAEFSRFAFVNVVSFAQTWVVAVGWPMLGLDYYPELAAHFIGLATSAFTAYVGHKHLTFSRSAQSDAQTRSNRC